MSYDIHLFIPIEGLTIEESFEAQCCSGGLKDLTDDEIQRHSVIVNRLKELEPKFEVIKDSQCTSLRDPHKIDISFYSSCVGISVPYWYSGAESDAVFSRLWGYLFLLGSEFFYHGYDGQLDEYYVLTDRSYLEKAIECNNETLVTIEKKFGPCSRPKSLDWFSLIKTFFRF